MKSINLFFHVVNISLLLLLVHSGFAQQSTDNTNGVFQNGSIISSVDGNHRTNLKNSSKPYDEYMVGVYNENKNIETPMVKTSPVIAGGIAYVKFNLENGIIKKGDPVTSSSETGVAMKALDSGVILGVALEDAGVSGDLLKIRVMIQYLK